MTAIENKNWPILVPSDYTIRDDDTLLVHQGAVLLYPEADRGRVIGYTVLCTDVLRTMWTTKPSYAQPNDTVVSCFDCLAACERST